MTADIFPSYVLEPKKTIDSITWFLNPIAEPPQKFLDIRNKNCDTDIYSDLLLKEGFVVRHVQLSEVISKSKNDLDDDSSLPAEWFNIIFSLANDERVDHFDEIVRTIHGLLRPSSYFIFETKIDNNLDYIKETLLGAFESVNFLSPWSNLTTNPFSPFDSSRSNYCWVAALSHSSDKDPGEWMDNL